MQTGPAAEITSVPNEGRDLFFKCEQCGISLVVDSAAAGLILTCQHCGKPTVIPASATTGSVDGGSPADQSNEKLTELQSRLKENESQRTEVTGYINQLRIQLHRWQLRLQMLDDRNRELSKEVATPRPADDPEPA